MNLVCRLSTSELAGQVQNISIQLPTKTSGLGNEEIEVEY
jgi:hypothetical protein